MTGVLLSGVDLHEGTEVFFRLSAAVADVDLNDCCALAFSFDLISDGKTVRLPGELLFTGHLPSHAERRELTRPPSLFSIDPRGDRGYLILQQKAKTYLIAFDCLALFMMHSQSSVGDG